MNRILQHAATRTERPPAPSSLAHGDLRLELVDGTEGGVEGRLANNHPPSRVRELTVYRSDAHESGRDNYACV